MEFTTIASLEKNHTADLLVIPYWKGKQRAELATQQKKLANHSLAPIEWGDFLGKEGELLLVYSNESRIALLGLGEKEGITIEKLRRSYSSLIKAIRQKKIESVAIFLPEIKTLPFSDTIRGISEGMLLANYRFLEYKKTTLTEDSTQLIKKAIWVGLSKAELALACKYVAITEEVYFARDLINRNADEVTPQYLCQIAKETAKKNKQFQLTIFDKKRLEKEKMGLLLAVGKGAVVEPAFIILKYTGAPKSQKHTVLVGKGVTFDTGGLHLKPYGGMETMKADMSGAAVALGTLRAAAALGIKANLSAVIPTAENAIGSHSYKPGDIYTSYSGKTVEIGNTDAEGRLILADALAYAVNNLQPTQMIDIATLTGAMEIILGHETIGLMSNNDPLAEGLLASGNNTYERLWRLPLFEEYREPLKSEMADIKNVGGRPAGSIMSALFLKEFVGEIPWAHLDIANVAFLSEARRYHPKHATGIGIRLLIDFIETDVK